MNTVNSKSFYSGLAIYAAFIALAALPIYAQPLNTVAVVQLAVAAIVASALVAVIRISGLAERLNDPEALLIQAALGIFVCCGLYAIVSPVSRPGLMIMAYMLWTAVSLPRLRPRNIIALFVLFLAAYLSVFTGLLTDLDLTERSDAIFMLMVSGIMTAFLYRRAAAYERVREEHRLQEVALEEAESRIHEFTTQDAETTALKYPYFRNQLIKAKTRVDQGGGTFSVGLIEIDHYDEMLNKIGNTASSQILREFTERATKLINRTCALEAWGVDYKPLGRMSGGRFSLLLAGADFPSAMKCAEALHSAMDFKSIRTHIGVFGITLSIGITEYTVSEGVDELMSLAARALKLAQHHNGNDYKGLKRPQRALTQPKSGLEAWNAHVVNN
ncbi:MAG: GGDEF domain-containing protein [Gammaproteobacteria bacterium]